MPATSAQPIVLAWSTGKDSALSLYDLRRGGQYNVVGLLTTLLEPAGVVGMHGVCEALLDRQAESLQLPVTKVRLPAERDDRTYQRRMQKALAGLAEQGVHTVAFGDIYLESLRQEREEKLAKAGFRAIFPLWQQDTALVAKRFLSAGFKAVVTNVDANAADETLAGHAYDENFLRRLDAGVDPCGENGEFHTFVYAGPVFRKSVAYEISPPSSKDGRFYGCELRPAAGGTP